jgi:hypothetical protein
MTTISDGGNTAPAERSEIPCAFEKRSGYFAISKVSACFVIAENGSRPLGANYATGDWARSRVHNSCG